MKIGMHFLFSRRHTYAIRSVEIYIDGLFVRICNTLDLSVIAILNAPSQNATGFALSGTLSEIAR